MSRRCRLWPRRCRGAGEPTAASIAELLGADLFDHYTPGSIVPVDVLADSWSDVTGDERHLVGAGTNDPNYFATGGYNNGPYVAADSNSYFDQPTLEDLNEGEIWYRIHLPNTAASYGLQRTAANDPNDYYNHSDGNCYIGWGSSVRRTIAMAAHLATQAEWHLLSIAARAGLHEVRINNNVIFTTSTNTVAFISGTHRFLNNGTAASALEVSEVAIASRVLTEKQRARMVTLM